MELRSPHDTAAADEGDDVGRAAADALRSAAVVGVDDPAAAAQQTGRPSRGPCGVVQAS